MCLKQNFEAEAGLELTTQSSLDLTLRGLKTSASQVLHYTHGLLFHTYLITSCLFVFLFCCVCAVLRFEASSATELYSLALQFYFALSVVL